MNSPSKTLYISGFNSKVVPEVFSDYFEKFGKLTRLDIPQPKYANGVPYGFVEYETIESAEAAFKALTETPFILNEEDRQAPSENGEEKTSDLPEGALLFQYAKSDKRPRGGYRGGFRGSFRGQYRGPYRGRGGYRDSYRRDRFRDDYRREGRGRGYGGPSGRDYYSRDYPPRDMPPRDYPPRDYPPRDYPPRDYPPRDYPPRDYPPRDMPPRDMPPREFRDRDVRDGDREMRDGDRFDDRRGREEFREQSHPRDRSPRNDEFEGRRSP